MSNNVLSIPKRPANSIDRDFESLRKEGLRHIEELAHQYWTDYNASDPGVTLLEALCYAITDLGLRIGMPIEDLLMNDQDQVLDLHRQFHSALRIMPSAPVTVLDYRKLFINIKGVKNAWLSKVEPEVFVDFAVDDETELPKSSYVPITTSEKVRSYQLGGLNNIKIEFEDEIQLLPKAKKKQAEKEIIERVRKVYHRNRNLCEDLVGISAVDQQEVVVCGEIELDPIAKAEEVNARMLQAIQDYLTPTIRFYSLEEILADPELRVDTIFNGPLFLQDTLNHDAILHALLGHQDLLPLVEEHQAEIEKLIGSELLDDPEKNLDAIRESLYDQLLFHGFIKNKELEQAGLRKEVRVSDLINLLQEVEGVKEVRDLVIGLCEPGKANEEEDCDCNDLDFAKLQWKICLPEGMQPVLCFSGSNFRFFKDFLPINVSKSQVKKLWVEGEDQLQDDRFATQIKDLPIPQGSYRSPEFHHSFQNDLPDTYGVGPKGLPPVPEGERPARLTKARQLKAYLSFFDQVLATYFAQLGKVKDLLSMDVELRSTYFTQVVDNVKDVQNIFFDYDEAPSKLEEILKNYDNFFTRRHQQLDHLVARFAERFNEYAFMLYDRFEGEIPEFLVGQKQAFLRDYPSQSSRRFTACNYYESADDYWDTNNVSGLQRRIGRLAGFPSRREDLFGATYEFYQEEDDDSSSEFRWRIRDNTGKIILSSSGKYTDMVKARAELKLTFTRAQNIANMPVLPTEEGDKWYFNVLTENALGEQEVIGRRIEFWPDKLKAEAARNYVADFLRGKSIELEGMYVIEHILLRPDLSKKNADAATFFPLQVDLYEDRESPLDPYSFRVSIVLPGWTQRFGDPDFRQFLERMIRLETPAHLMPKICWVSPEQMQEFVNHYKHYLKVRSLSPEKQADDETLIAFLAQLNELRTVYWPGTLHDCVDEGAEEEDNPILLNRTFLGNLENQESDADND